METASLATTLGAFDDKPSEEVVGSPQEIRKPRLFDEDDAIEK